MDIPIKPSHARQLDERLEALAPWMHAYKLGPDTYTGYFKYDGLTATWVNGSSPGADRQRLRDCYDKFVAREEWSKFLTSLLTFGDAGDLSRQSIIDIGSGGGRNSILAARAGFGAVTAAEIREHQSSQLQAILEAADDERLSRQVRAVHEPTSADDPAFGERYAGAFDVAMSLGVLYHLANPWQHLVNLRRVARRRAIIYTMTHQYPLAKQMWAMTPEDPKWITKATAGISWMPHYLEVKRLCRVAGFSHVAIRYPDRFVRHFPSYNDPSRRQDIAQLANMLWHRLTGQRTGPLRNHDAAYFHDSGLNPNYFAYVCEI